MPTRTGTREQRLAVAGTVAVLLLGLVLILAGGGASGQDPPATGAAAIVPADALGYLNVSLDPRRPAVRQATARLPDYPILGAALLSRITAIVADGGQANYAGDIRPWLGNEAALALLNTATSTAGSLIVLDVRDHRRAAAFLTHAGAQPQGQYRGTRLLSYSSGTTLAFVSHFLVLGQQASVEAAIDVADGHGSPLRSDPGYRRAAAGEPPDRVLDAYLSAPGVRRLLGARHGLIGALSVLLYQPALTGVTLSLSPAAHGARIRIHSALDPTLAQISRSSSDQFTPTLQTTVPSGSALMLDLSGLNRVAPGLLSAGAAAGIGGGIAPLLARLGGALSAEGVDVHGVLGLFSGETAVTISGSRPALTIIARTRDPSQARAQLAALELPLEQLFPAPSSGPGQAPLFGERNVGGITIHQLALAPGLEFNYAVFNGLVVVSTGIAGIAAVATRRRSLASDTLYNTTLAGTPERVRSLLFLDFSQLLSLGEQTDLTRSSRFLAVRRDLEKIRTIGLSSMRGEADTTAELFLHIP